MQLFDVLLRCRVATLPIRLWDPKETGPYRSCPGELDPRRVLVQSLGKHANVLRGAMGQVFEFSILVRGLCQGDKGASEGEVQSRLGIGGLAVDRADNPGRELQSVLVATFWLVSG